MHRFIQAGAGLTLITLAACTPPHVHHHAAAPLERIAALDCPDTQGELTRKSRSPDGKSCVYATDKGGEVDLQLLALDGRDPKSALAPLEATLEAEVPAAANRTASAAGGDHDKVDIDLPGIHIHANGKDDANVDVGGMPGKVVVDGDANHSSVDVGAGGVSVHAHDKGAEININESRSGVRLTYILTADSPGPSGFRLVGYEARGPVGGPLAVASLKSKSDDADDLRDDARDLLHLNVGG